MEPEHGPPIATIRPSVRAMLRVSFRIFLVILAVGVPMALWKGTTPEKLVNGLMAASLIVPALALLLTLLVAPLGLRVYPHGIVGRSYWGPRRLLRWHEIGDLVTDHSSGVALLMIVGRDVATTLWTVPSVIEDPEFQRLATQYATVDHPLVEGLRAHS